MKALKKLGSITLIAIILLTGFIQLENKSYFVFADSATDQWESVTTNQELAEAFRYYCKSRNLTIDGSVLDAITTFTTNSFNTICNTLGIDVTALQAHLKRSTDSNGKLQFLFDQFGITAYNRIFAEFLQNNNIAVGDDVPETNLYDGKSVNGNLLTIYHTNSSGYNVVDVVGTHYQYDETSLYDFFVNHSSNDTIPFTLPNGNSYSLVKIFKNNYNSNNRWYFWITSASGIDGYYQYYYISSRYTGFLYGYPSLGYNSSTGVVSLGCTQDDVDSTKIKSFKVWTNISSQNVENTVIFITTNNNTINNNTYTDNRQTVINNEGDVYNYDYDDDDPPIDPPPEGGDSPSDWGVELPDLDINWILAGKENKFPFDIPFNIMFALSLLNAEPEAPHFEGTINFGFTSYNYDVDFIQFDPVAVIFRRLMFLAFIIGLMFLTKQLIWG